MDANGRDVRRISYTQSNYCTSPEWSPEGDKIAFVCRRNGYQLFVVSPRGGAATQLTFDGINEDPAWSPDGRYLVFSSNFTRDRVKNIGVVELSTGMVKQITQSRSSNEQPSWSPVFN